ncbi:hypothetical protein ACV35H_34845, partial [Pseudomonas aeruginosa]
HDKVHRVVEAWNLRGAHDYNADILDGGDLAGSGAGSFDLGDGSGDGGHCDQLYLTTVRFDTDTRRAPIHAVPRMLDPHY